MADIECRAAEAGRWLLTLDTAGDATQTLYRSLGYALAGTIPLYARDPFAADRCDATRFMYKDLRDAWASKLCAPLLSRAARRGGEPQPEI